MSKKEPAFGIVSYNIYCNFTNYGSALQSWSLHKAINRLGDGRWKGVLVDYCPDILADKNPLDPIKHMWDTDAESRKMCELSLPAIRENYVKFDEFYKNRFNRTTGKYTSANFNEVTKEGITGFVCGSDTIFCIDEFGFDDGYYANYDCMKNGYTISYAASFGDSHFTEEKYQTLNNRLQNFNALGLREREMVEYVSNHVAVPVQRVVDPTLLLTVEDFDEIAAEPQETEKYLLLYARRYNPKMEAYAEKLAEENGWKIVEISLRATNASKHRMFYEAGVEEFLSLVKNAEYVVTNSFHGAILSVHYRRPFNVFSRELCDTKIIEVLELFGLTDRLMVNGDEQFNQEIDYEQVHERIANAREKSLEFLETNLSRAIK